MLQDIELVGMYKLFIDEFVTAASVTGAVTLLSYYLNS